MNKVILIGNLANDPEAFTTQSGISRSTLTGLSTTACVTAPIILLF